MTNIEVDEIEVTQTASADVDIANSNVVASVEDTTDLEITVNKREYSIVGDGLYAGQTATATPQWMADLIDDAVASATASTITALQESIASINTSLQELAIAKNRYEELINIDATIDGVVATKLETLNATVQQNSADIIQLDTAKVTPDSALAITVDHINAEIDSGDISALVTQLDSAIVNGDSANAASVNSLETIYNQNQSTVETILSTSADEYTVEANAITELTSAINDIDGELQGTATASDNLYTYVGYDANGNTTGTGLTEEVSILQKQADGVINTYADDHDVMLTGNIVLTAHPYTLYTTLDLKIAAIGDTYIKYVANPNGTKDYVASYKFIQTIVNVPVTDSDGFTWALITDTAAQDAYAAALNAYDLADGKRRVFTDVPTVPYDVGDLWTQGITGDLLRCKTAKTSAESYALIDWELASKYTDDQYALDLQTGVNAIDLSNHVNDLLWQTDVEVAAAASTAVGTFITDTYTGDQVAIQASLDGKIESYFQNTQPYNPLTATLDKDGDTWFNPDANLLYRYVFATTEWVLIEDQKAIDAFANAATAQSTADGKIVTYYQDAEPVAEGIGDLWIDTNDGDKLYRWNGTIWDYTSDDTALDGFITVTYAADLVSTQGKIDGKSVSYFQDTIPYLASAGTSVQDGDTWYNSTNSELRVFKYDVATPAWELITDPYIQGAYDDASTAQATADGKITTFYQDTEPVAEGLGDLWIDTNNNDKLYIWNGAIWAYTSDDSALDTFLVATYATDLLNTQNQIDGKSVSYFQDAEPYLASAGTAEQDGDVWYNLTTKELKVFHYHITTPSWDTITDPYIQGAYDDAALAQASADGKIQSFTSEPTHPYYIGDVWMQGPTGDIYVCNTASTTVFNQAHWTIASKYTDDQAAIDIINGTSQIDLSDHINTLGWTTDDSLDAFLVGTYASDLLNTQNQIDGKSVSYFQDTIPYLASAGVASQDGDVWYNLTTQELKVFHYHVTTPSWDTITDPYIQGAYDDAAIAQASADGKIQSFTAEPTHPYFIGDVWMQGSTGDIYVCSTASTTVFSQAHWVLASKYTDNQYAIDIVNGVNQIDLADHLNSIGWTTDATIDGVIAGTTQLNLGDHVNDVGWTDDTTITNFISTTYATDLSNISTQIDGKSVSYFQDTQPFNPLTGTAAMDGDTWFNTSTNKLYVYKFSTTSWDLFEDQKAIDAFANAATAQSAADGKVTSFYSVALPLSPYSVGDVWVQGATGDIYISTVTRSGLLEELIGDWEKASKYTDDSVVDNFITVTYAADLLNIGDQIDGKADSYFQDAEPFNPLTATVDKNGDTWYAVTSKELKVYNFSTTSWDLITDPYIQGAYDDAALAQASADGKIQNFTAEPTHPYYVGDTWMQGVTGDIYVCNTNSTTVFSQAHWSIASKYTDDSSVVLLQNGLEGGTIAVDLSLATVDGVTSIADYVGAEIDGIVDVYSGTDHTAQVGMSTNDIFIEKTVDTTGAVDVDVVNTYVYNGVSWDEIGSNTNLTNLADLADGKRTIFNTAAPTGMVERDMWIPNTVPTDGTKVLGEVYIYNGTIWELATKYTENLDNFVDNTYTPAISSLQGQIDGKIDSYYQNTAPYPNGTSDATKDGDLWYDLDAKLLYVYQNSITTWSLVQDQAAIDAAADAATAQATADGKMSVYYAIQQSTTPADAGTNVVAVGDASVLGIVPIYWLDTSVGNVLKKYVSSGVWSTSGIPLAEGDELKTMVIDTTATGKVDYYIYTYTSSAWVKQTLEGLVAKSGWSVDLDAWIGTSGAEASLEVATQTTSAGVVTTALEYTTNTVINGVYYNSGFGLETLGGGTGTDIDPYTSEFWINAEKFKFTNTAQSGATAPFTIDASGATPQITFDGIVAFTNVTGTPDFLVDADLGESGTTVIDGGRITTGSMSAFRVRTGKIVNTDAYDVNGDYKGDGHVDTSMIINLDTGSIWIR